MSQSATPMFSDYIVYVDESGDHSLESINPEYPLFVLSFCIFRKDVYANTMTPAVRKLKFETDELVFDLYGLTVAERGLVLATRTNVQQHDAVNE